MRAIDRLLAVAGTDKKIKKEVIKSIETAFLPSP